MDFIKVTLLEELTQKPPSKHKKYEGYLLPIHAINTIDICLNNEFSHSINITEIYKPTHVGFTVGFAYANLPAGFVRVVNQ